MKKTIYIILGSIFFALGIFGYYMPLIPGTIFMIISAYFFMASSKKLYTKTLISCLKNLNTKRKKNKRQKNNKIIEVKNLSKNF